MADYTSNTEDRHSHPRPRVNTLINMTKAASPTTTASTRTSVDKDEGKKNLYIMRCHLFALLLLSIFYMNSYQIFDVLLRDKATTRMATVVSEEISLLPEELPLEDEDVFDSPDEEWSNVKLAIYMTTHLPESHIMFLPCWNDAVQRMEIFKYADLILYTPSQPAVEHLNLLPFQNTIIKTYNNSGYQSGAIQAMVDPFVENVTWFDDYDWVIRLNTDVLIRDDTWLIQTMLDPSIDAIFHDCHNRRDYPLKPTLHSDFYAFRPNAVDRDLVLAARRIHAETHVAQSLKNIYDARRFAYLEGANNTKPGRCRIEGEKSPVLHVHELAKFCPYYYNATKEGLY